MIRSSTSAARASNLKDVDVDVPRDVLAVFTGVSGSGKSSLAFGTIYAEAQRRNFESVAPYARRLLNQAGVPKVGDITGLPPAVALQQRRGGATSRSTVGTITTLSNSLRMLFSRAGSYPPEATEVMDSDWFSPNTAIGACRECHGLGKVHRVSEQTLVPDPSLTIRDRAVVVVEHDMGVVAGSDWVIDLWPGAGEEGGRIIAAGPPDEVARAEGSKTAPYLAQRLEESGRAAVG